MSDSNRAFSVVDKEFERWRQEAEENNLLDKVSTAFYLQNDAKYLFSLLVERSPYSSPVFTYRRWTKQSGFDSIETGFDETEIRQEVNWEDLARHSASRGFDEGRMQGKIDDYISNYRCLAVTEISDDRTEFEFAETDSYSVSMTAAKLRYELLDELYEHDISPSCSFYDLIDALDDMELPIRETFFPNFKEIINIHEGLRLANITSFPLINTPDGYVMLFQEIPGPTENKSWVRPYPTKPLPVVESGENMVKQGSLKNLKSSLCCSDQSNVEEYISDHSLVGIGVGCTTTEIHFTSLLKIEDTDFYENCFDLQEINESAENPVFAISVSDTDSWRDILTRKLIKPTYHLSVSQTVFEINEELSDVTVDIDVERA